MTVPVEATDPYVAERRREILAGARTVFVRHGFERATMAQIASEVGLTAGALYRYFPNKESLITTVCGAAGVEMMQPFGEIAEGGQAMDLLLEGGNAIWAAMETPTAREDARMLLEATVAGMRHPETVGAELSGEMAATRAQLAGLIELARTEGSLPSDVDSTTMASLLVGATLGIKMLQIQLDGDVSAVEIGKLLTRMLRGLGAPGGES